MSRQVLAVYKCRLCFEVFYEGWHSLEPKDGTTERDQLFGRLRWADHGNLNFPHELCPRSEDDRSMGLGRLIGICPTPESVPKEPIPSGGDRTSVLQVKISSETTS